MCLQQTCLLLSLPTELRNKIWTLVLQFDPSAERIVLKREQNPLNLLQTCRQIYHEGRLIPFHINYFSAHASSLSNVASLQKILTGLHPWQRHAIRKLDFRFITSVKEASAAADVLQWLWQNGGENLHEDSLAQCKSLELTELKLSIVARSNWLLPFGDVVEESDYCFHVETDPWISNGLIQLPGLKILKINIKKPAADGFSSGQCESFRNDLRRVASWIRDMETGTLEREPDTSTNGEVLSSVSAEANSPDQLPRTCAI